MTASDLLGPLLILTALVTGTVATAAPLTLIYSGNLDGELEPCGCTAETDYGGLSRRATYLDGLRADGADPVVITTGGLLTADIGADRIKARFILTGLEALDYDAVGVQWSDLVYGRDFLTGHSLPYVASNWSGDDLPPSQLITRTDVRLRLFQWLDPSDSPRLKMAGSQREVHDDTSLLATALAGARTRGETTLLMTTLPLERAQAELPLADVNLLLVAATPENPGEVRQVGSMLVLSPGTRGMRLGRVDLDIGADGSLGTWQASTVELTDSVPDAARLADWYAAYNDALRQDYMRSVKARKARTTGTSPYTGAKTCTVCHQAATTAWQASRHAGALDALEQVGKAFDPNCVVCHSVGFGQDGGFLAMDETPGLANVQCESCHGPGRTHVETAGESYPEKRVATEACAGCHHPNHSPAFAYTDYWPRIVHGLD
ncbi:MAG: hypothetical protein DRR03_07145 [Gammaproteobacteria bacterium]|nr:MAG: hypothetical protein DRR03_07145 [Gammaproteobacteria bacterium]